MDSLTHIYFAEKLLTATGKDRSAAVASLFPQIDRQPAYFHRMYGHPYFQLRKLAPIATEVYKTGEIRPGFEDVYAWKRYHEERPRMLGFVEEYESDTGDSLGEFDPDYTSVLIAYASHTYQDIFNNPMQGFLPRSVYPSGKWELWASLDAIDFRAVLYEPSTIAAFRAEFFGDSLWDTQLDPVAIVKAMVSRTAVASVVQVPQFLIDEAFEALEAGDEPDADDTAAAEEFLVLHEELLSRLIRKYSTPRVLAPVGAGPEEHHANYPVGS